MAYRGMDLDLRTPVRPRSARDPGVEADPIEGLNVRRARVQAYSGARPADPIWVDDTVLACSNHAFDVALAHGSAEVRLEHLVLALTKVEAAARVLEERGFREGQLRRECAALIASEMPTGPMGERGPPRRSDEFADVLRRAAQRAAQRGAAAGVEDVLAALLAHPDDLPAVLVLRAHGPDWSRTSRGLADASPVTASQRLELTTVHDPMALRLDALEGTMRAVQTDLAADRRLLADLARDIQRELIAQRTDIANRLQTIEHSLGGRLEATRLPVKALERLQVAEAGIETRLSDLARLWTLTSERLLTIETAVDARSPEAGASRSEIAERLDKLGQIWSGLEARLQAMERGWQAREAQAHAAPRTALERLAEVEAMVHGGLARVAERLASLETSLSEQSGHPQRAVDLTGRMEALERSVLSGLQDGARNWAALGQRLQAFEAAIAGGRQVEAGLRQVSERWDALGDRLTGIEAVLTDPRTSHPGGDSQFEHRLGAVEAAIAAQRADAVEHRLALTAQMDALASAAAQPGGLDMSRLQATVAERLDALRQEFVSADGAGVLGHVVERLDSLKATGEARQREAVQTWAALTERMVAIETGQRDSAASASEASLAHQRSIANLAEATARLSNAHETLHTAFADWRYDQQGDTTTVAAGLRDILVRLETTQARNGHANGMVMGAPASPAPPTSASNGATAQPAAKPSPPATSTAADSSSPRPLRAAMSRSGVRLPQGLPARKGLWIWLFGTDNVRQANAEAELRWRAVHRRWRNEANPET